MPESIKTHTTTLTVTKFSFMSSLTVWIWRNQTKTTSTRDNTIYHPSDLHNHRRRTCTTTGAHHFLFVAKLQSVTHPLPPTFQSAHHSPVSVPSFDFQSLPLTTLIAVVVNDLASCCHDCCYNEKNWLIVVVLLYARVFDQPILLTPINTAKTSPSLPFGQITHPYSTIEYRSTSHHCQQFCFQNFICEDSIETSAHISDDPSPIIHDYKYYTPIYLQSQHRLNTQDFPTYCDLILSYTKREHFDLSTSIIHFFTSQDHKRTFFSLLLIKCLMLLFY